MADQYEVARQFRWIQFASAALSAFDLECGPPHEDADIARQAGQLADAMEAEWQSRFPDATDAPRGSDGLGNGHWPVGTQFRHRGHSVDAGEPWKPASALEPEHCSKCGDTFDHCECHVKTAQPHGIIDFDSKRAPNIVIREFRPKAETELHVGSRIGLPPEYAKLVRTGDSIRLTTPIGDEYVGRIEISEDGNPWAEIMAIYKRPPSEYDIGQREWEGWPDDSEETAPFIAGDRNPE